MLVAWLVERGVGIQGIVDEALVAQSFVWAAENEEEGG